VIPNGTYVCEEHGERVEVSRVIDFVDGAVLLPGSILCSECGKQLRLIPEDHGGN
jgi:hypothetical protein